MSLLKDSALKTDSPFGTTIISLYGKRTQLDSLIKMDYLKIILGELQKIFL
jgi:hypothetical protein